MNRLKALFAVAMLSLSLGGCAGWTKFETTVSNAVGVLGSTKINSKTAYVAINSMNATERLVTAYLRLPQCNGSIPLCRAPGAAQALDGPFNAAISASNDLWSFMRANPGTLADAGLYNTLTSAAAALQNVMNIYGVGSK